MGRSWILIAFLMAGVVAAIGGAVVLAAMDGAPPYVTPKTPLAREVYGLFNLTLGIALFVFVLVEGLLLYTLWRFRNNRKVPRDETERGHTAAEVTWTVIPAIILILLGVLSAGTLMRLDTIPEDTDFTVKVEAFQWGWRFVYPDGNATVNELRVEEGQKVRLELVSRDVIHAFWVPEFAIKIDTVPGRTNVQWFEAPPVEGADVDEYFVQCAEYCGLGHHDMRAKVVIFRAGAQAVPYGKAPAAAPAPEG